MTDALHGGCACGKLRYRMEAKPMFVHCCHCQDCQRQTGTAFVLNALIEADRVVVSSGETQGYPQPTESGRCPEARSADLGRACQAAAALSRERSRT